jgi:hypothetical protein
MNGANGIGHVGGESPMKTSRPINDLAYRSLLIPEKTEDGWVPRSPCAQLAGRG